MIMAARKPRLVAGGTEREAGSGNHVGSAVELQVVGMELEEVREVAAALKKARERMSKTLVGEEGCTLVENGEAELAFLEQWDVLTTVAKSSDFSKLLCNTIIYVLHLDDTFTHFCTLGQIHPYQSNPAAANSYSSIISAMYVHLTAHSGVHIWQDVDYLKFQTAANKRATKSEISIQNQND